MLHVQFRLDSHRRRVLGAVAEQSAVSMSELMREAVDLLLTQRGVTQVAEALPGVMPASEVRDLPGWDPPTAAGLPVVDDLDQIA